MMQRAVIISLTNIKRLVFVLESLCFLYGSNWICVYQTYLYEYRCYGGMCRHNIDYVYTDEHR